MERSKDKVFYIDSWRVSPREGVLSRGNEIVRLEPKTMEVLVYFACRPNEVLTREELEQDVWHGAVVGYDAVTNTIIKLRKALQDNARQPHIIATIPKKGYQLIAPVSYGEEGQSAATPDTPLRTILANPQGEFRQRHMRKNAVILVVGILLAGIITLWGFANRESGELQVSDTGQALPSIIILPFESLSGDAGQERLADGITDDIITDLSRLSNVLVISGNTSSVYQDRQLSSKEIASELGVKFILNGSVRLVGDKIRINTQLYNAETGFNVWAQRYDRKVDEIFSVQDEVTQNIVRSLTINISSKERTRLAQRATDSLRAYDYFQEGQRLGLPRTRQALIQARAAYKNAIKFDPNYGRAYGAMAITMNIDYINGWVDAPVETLDRALTLAQKAVELDDSTPQTYWALGFTYLMRKEYDQAERAVSQSVRIAPNYADGYGLLALIKMYRGEPEQALTLNAKGMKLNPYYSWQYLYTQGGAYYMQGNYQAAIAELEKAQQRNETAVQVKVFLAACYVNANRQSDAEWLVDEMQVLSPTTTLSDVEKAIPIINPRIKQVLIADLRQAGLPD